MADNTSIKCDTFGDMVSICLNRGQIAGEVQDRDLNLIKGLLNEHNINISTERDWHWRKFDRDIVFDKAISTGTVSVTQDSKAIVFTGLTVDETLMGRSFKVNGDTVLYRIIGLDIGANTAYLSAPFIGTTNATANYKIYNYEFALPPDCDEITQLYYDNALIGFNWDNGDLVAINNSEFNRLLAQGLYVSTVPQCYTRDGKVSSETLPPLNEMILNYDFIGGDPYEAVDKLRVFPIEPDQRRVLHLNYSVQVAPMTNDSDVPLMPVDNRWVLVHLTLGDWFQLRGQLNLAQLEIKKGLTLLKEMRDEFKQTDPSPKFILSKSRYVRRTYYDYRYDLFWLSRQGEY